MTAPLYVHLVCGGRLPITEVIMAAVLGLKRGDKQPKELDPMRKPMRKTGRKDCR